MKSNAMTVEKYLAEVPEERRPALETLREMCLDELTGQKNYISLYVLRERVIEANAHLFDGLLVGKGCIRFKRPEQIDPTIVRSLLSGSAADTGPIS